MNSFKKIKNLLTLRRELRDDKEKFIACMMSEEGLSRTDAEVIARHYKKASTYDRYWRQVQEKNPYLRGKDWLHRQRVKTQEVKESLGY